MPICKKNAIIIQGKYGKINKKLKKILVKIHTMNLLLILSKFVIII